MLSILLPCNREPRINELIEDIEGLPAYEIIIAQDRYGLGKGWALREAFKQAKGDKIAFLDGDGDIHPRMLRRLFPFLEDFDIVVGSKRIAHKSYTRRVISILSRIYLRLIFGLSVDTQTGIKLFRREALEYWKEDGFLFDVEILVEAKKAGLTMIEIPIDAEINAKLSWRVVWKTLMESINLKFRL